MEKGNELTGGAIGTMEAPSLYDLVKKSIYALWLECLMYQKKLNRDRVQVTLKHYGSGETGFKMGVLALWEALRFKLDYHPKENCVIKLKEFEKNGGFEQGNKFKLADAERAFRYMTEFMEKDGITRFELKKPRADLEVLDGLNEEDF